MPKRMINPPELVVPARFARGVELTGSGRVVYLGGTAPVDAAGETIGAGSMRDQVAACLGKIAQVVEYAGGSMNDVVQLTFYMTDLSLRSEVHEARAKYWEGPYFPAITGVQVAALANPEWLVEVDGLAFIE